MRLLLNNNLFRLLVVVPQHTVTYFPLWVRGSFFLHVGVGSVQAHAVWVSTVLGNYRKDSLMRYLDTADMKLLSSRGRLKLRQREADTYSARLHQSDPRTGRRKKLSRSHPTGCAWCLGGGAPTKADIFINLVRALRPCLRFRPPERERRPWMTPPHQ